MKEMIIIIILMTFFNNTEITYSQITQEWTARYGQNELDGRSAIITDKVGNVYVTGAAGNPEDIVTIKYSSSGQQEWLARYNGPGNGRDGSNSIKIDNKGNVIVAGKSEGIGTNFDFITIQYSLSGEQKWFRRYAGIGNQYDEVSSIGIDSIDNIYIAGISNQRYAIIKYDSAGTQQWVNFYGTENNVSYATAIIIDKYGNIYVTGQSGEDSTSSIDIVTIKYNSFGILKWVAKYNSPTSENDYGMAIGVDSDGSIYVCGGSQGDLHYDDYILVKYDSLGAEQWNRRYNGSGNFSDQARALVIDKLNNVYISGYATQAGTGNDFTTIKYNPFGDQIWLRKYNNGLNDFCEDLTIDRIGNIYVEGASDGNGTNYDYATIKYNASGNQLWAVRYDYSGVYPDYPSSIAVDNNGSVHVTGQSNRDYLTIKYSQLTGAIINESNIPTEYKLSWNYPNPFNPTTKIKFDITRNVRREMQDVKLVVYDVLGSEVVTLINESKTVGSYEVEFDATGFPSGIYFYSLLIDGNVIDTKRMILLK